MIVSHRSVCFCATTSSWQHVCLCRPYEPGLHLDGSELTGLLQEDRQERTTTDPGQSFPTGTQALLTCFSCPAATGKASVTPVLLLLPRSSKLCCMCCIYVFAVLRFYCNTKNIASRCICNFFSYGGKQYLCRVRTRDAETSMCIRVITLPLGFALRTQDTCSNIHNENKSQATAVLLLEYPATSSELSQQTAEVPTQENETADLNSPDSMHIEVDEHAEQQEAAGESPAAEQVFMYLQVSL